MNNTKRATKRSVIFSYVVLLSLFGIGYVTVYQIAEKIKRFEDVFINNDVIINSKLNYLDNKLLSYMSNFDDYKKNMEKLNTLILTDAKLVKQKLESIQIDPISEYDMMLIRSSLSEHSSVRVINNE